MPLISILKTCVGSQKTLEEIQSKEEKLHKAEIKLETAKAKWRVAKAKHEELNGNTHGRKLLVLASCVFSRT
jgi:hypothetical protein